MKKTVIALVVSVVILFGLLGFIAVRLQTQVDVLHAIIRDNVKTEDENNEYFDKRIDALDKKIQGKSPKIKITGDIQ